MIPLCGEEALEDSFAVSVTNSGPVTANAKADPLRFGRDDLTESVIGGLARSEHEATEVAVRLRPHRGWEVAGSLGLREFEDLFAVRLPIHRNRTIGGLIVEQLGAIPAGGEQVQVGDLTFEVVGVSRGRVRKLLVCFPVRSS